MKKVVTISLIIFGLIVVIIFIVGLIFWPSQDSQIVNEPAANNDSLSNQANRSNTTTNTPPDTSYSLQDIAMHNTAEDCWMIIDNKVYDFTNYLKMHPSGAASMTPYCGADGTQGYDTKDKKQPTPHSSTADSLLKDYYLGELQ